MRAWIFVLAFAVGAAAGHLVGTRAQPVAPAAPAVMPASPRVAPALDAAALTAEIRRAVADECHAAPAAPPTAAPAAAAPAESPEAAEAHDRGLALVETGLAAGGWTDADVLALRPLVARMTGEQREQVLGTLLPALNDGRLRAEFGPGPPF